VLEIFQGLGRRVGDGFEEGQNEVIEDEDVVRGGVFTTGAGVFAEKDILVPVHDLNAPMLAIEVHQVLRRSLGFGQAGNQINDFFFRRKPLAFLLALNDAADTADLLNRRPIIPDVCGLDRQHVDGHEAGAMSFWLQTELTKLGLPIVCMENFRRQLCSKHSATRPTRTTLAGWHRLYAWGVVLFDLLSYAVRITKKHECY